MAGRLTAGPVCWDRHLPASAMHFLRAESHSRSSRASRERARLHRSDRDLEEIGGVLHHLVRSAQREDPVDTADR